MPSVPSHDRSFFQEAIDRAGIPAHRSAPSSASIPLNSLSSFTRRSIPFVLSHFTKHSPARPYGAIHLLTWCAGQTGSPVCATRRLV